MDIPVLPIIFLKIIGLSFNFSGISKPNLDSVNASNWEERRWRAGH